MFQLRGMRAVGAEMTLKTWRPLLQVSKSEIREFSRFNSLARFSFEFYIIKCRKFCIPHLQDSTSPLCERGHFRDKIIPYVQMHQPLLLPGLEKLADNLSFLHGILSFELDELFEKVDKFQQFANILTNFDRHRLSQHTMEVA